RFPFKDEGFLTEIRSKIVNRESLNNLAKKIGLGNLIDYQQHNKNLTPKSMFGDSLEALIGAVYLDKGFGFCRKFILTKLLSPHFDLEDLINTITNHKSRIIEWGQKENKTIVFDMVENENNQKLRQFVAQIVIDGIPYEKGFGPSKKKAEQDAARKTLEHLEVSNQ
ncbi:MAG: putative dsRNA-binding protein, partial [Cyclobacteriaceae bacterium]|nr:putative dsRNA-binding protein [Cyclobacteriaceae bacterium]